MKIGITGTHCTGKTSLAHALMGTLKGRGYNAGITREFVRECPIPAGTEGRNSPTAQAWIIGRQLIEEIEAANSYEMVICDRTVIDNYAYFLWTLKTGMKADPAIVQTVQDILNNWAHSYDYLFKLPIATPLQPDGFRSTDPGWQREINSLIDQIIAERKLQINKIALAPNSQRVAEILKILKLE